MAKCGKEILINREGTEQMQRFLDALNPGSVKLNDFGLKEWMMFAFRFANHVNYFDINNFETPSGNWEDFFEKDKELEACLLQVENGKTISPHLALFVCFIKLLEFTQKRFNKLTKRHLDFYYNKILQIEKLPAVSDQVHVIFEIAKNIVSEKIGKSTELDAKKDANGKKLIYKTTEELIANKIKVAQLKSVYNDLDNHKLKAAEKANSFDGIGGDFPDGDSKWWPFGYYDKNSSNKQTKEKKDSVIVKKDLKDADNETYPELSDAKIGFAISSEILELKEGLRNIKVTIDFSESLDSFSPDLLYNNIEIYCSGEKEWLGPFFIEEKITYEKEDVLEEVYSSSLSNKKLSLAFQIPKEKGALVNYDSKVHAEYFNSKLPVCRFIIKTEEPEGHDLYLKLAQKEVTKITVEVDVRDVKSLLLESDIGTLNAEKPFYPFGTQPVRKSNFYIGYPELFKKEWTNMDVEIEWKNTPENFKNLYYAYREKHRYKVTPITYFAGLGAYTFFDAPQISNVVLGKIEFDAAAGTAATSPTQVFNPSEEDLIVKNDNYFEVNIEIQDKEEWEIVHKERALFEKDIDLYKTKFSVANAGYTVDKNGPVRLSLKQSFLQELFPRIYALALSSKDDNALIPNEPYIPFVETVRLNYTAESSFTPGTTNKIYTENQVMLFHEHPFGQTEEHKYLRGKLEFIDNTENKDFLVPTYCKGGELYIGLEKVEKQQTVSLLVQVMEGSENPLTKSFAGKEKVEWSVLCSNEWKTLDSNYMITNGTDNFLKSGIVKFSMPKDATSTNTMLPEKYIWVRAKMNKDFDVVCKTRNIVAQAVLAEFWNNDNDLAHLEKGLEAKTISKLIQRVSSVKSVGQPYSSFNGKPEESDEAYYRRISERLRHKNRAISIWDYEHIILQEFPEIHKVKCLNHSWVEYKEEETIPWFLSPGNVLVVVIPDIINKNVFDIYQPRVSTATLNKIQKWINKLNTLHVNAQVINPVYEEVTVNLKVKFLKGFDENYYKKVLNSDITKLLSPWAFENTATISFGVTLHRSIVINYIEKLGYVDYVEDVKLKKGSEPSSTSVAPSSPIAILVSAKDHGIELAESACGNGIKETEEKCHK